MDQQLAKQNLAVDLTQHAQFASFGASGTALEFILIDNANAMAANSMFTGLVKAHWSTSVAASKES